MEFSFDTLSSKMLAFSNMGRKSVFTEKMKGLRFFKAMGTGAGNGFSVVPNFSRYAFLLLFDNRENAESSIAENDAFNVYFDKATHFFRCHLKPAMVHGVWDGVQPFEIEENAKPEDPVAVITRARINTSKILDFWWNVSEAGRFMNSRDEAIYQIGIGEYPVFMQATFSIWKTMKEMKNAAYNGTPHAEVVKKTRERNWYSEEMFCVFKLGQIIERGTLPYEIPEKLILSKV
ncbi:MAG TPA: hypothetical protein VJ911_05220 [Cryomorphaceae bacterium]|nr:hypothetical protein [Cryomorphaceae bacterium]